MAGMATTTEIQRPVEDVYGFFLDMEHSIVGTDPMVESVVKATDGPAGAGAKYVLRQRVMGTVREQEMWVTAVDPNRRIDMEAAFGPVRPKFNLTFEPSATGTRVTFRGESRPVGALKLVTPLMDRVGQRNWKRRLGLVKATLRGNLGSRVSYRRPVGAFASLHCTTKATTPCDSRATSGRIGTDDIGERLEVDREPAT